MVAVYSYTCGQILELFFLSNFVRKKLISQNVKLFLENAVFKTSVLRVLGPRINGVAEWV